MQASGRVHCESCQEYERPTAYSDNTRHDLPVRGVRGGEGRGGRSSALASRGAHDERQRDGTSTSTRHGTSFRGCSRGPVPAARSTRSYADHHGSPSMSMPSQSISWTGTRPVAHEDGVGRHPGDRPRHRGLRRKRYFTATKTLSATRPGLTARTPFWALADDVVRRQP